LRSDPGFNNLLGDNLQTISIDFVVSFVDGEVDPICSVYLDIQKPRAKDGYESAIRR
jgi:hypothetical protein